jgi:hypothetical protein
MSEPRLLPLHGHAVSDVTGTGRFDLWFDDPAQSRLSLDGSFQIRIDNHTQEYTPPYSDWVRDVLLSFVGVRINSARYTRHSRLTIRFSDDRELIVEDGPYENWHYSNSSGLILHGGIGRVA